MRVFTHIYTQLVVMLLNAFIVKRELYLLLSSDIKFRSKSQLFL